CSHIPAAALVRPPARRAQQPEARAALLRGTRRRASVAPGWRSVAVLETNRDVPRGSHVARSGPFVRSLRDAVGALHGHMWSRRAALASRTIRWHRSAFPGEP